MAINRTDQSKRAIKGDKIGGFCSPLGRAGGKEGGKNKEEQLDSKNIQEVKLTGFGMDQIWKVRKMKESRITLTFWHGQLGAQWCQPLDGGYHRRARVLGDGKQGPLNIIPDLPSVELQCQSKSCMYVSRVQRPGLGARYRVQALHFYWH